MKKIILTLQYFVFFTSLSIGQKQIIIPIDGGQLFVKTFGKGDPLLIINGGPGMNSNGFDSLAKLLSESHTTILFDHRGTGKSLLNTVDSTSITLDLMVKDIETIRSYLKINRWVILGHSFGGMLASFYASRFPDKTKGLILSSSGGVDMRLFTSLNILDKLPVAQKDSFEFYNSKIAHGDTTFVSKFKKAQFLANAYLYNKSDKMINTIARRMLEADYKIFGLVMANMHKNKFDCRQDLKSFDKPVLILQGKEDFINEKIACAIDSTFHNAKLTMIDKCGHYGWLDQPKIYFNEINSYLKQIREN